MRRATSPRCSASSVTYVEDSTAPALPASLASSPAWPGERQLARDLRHRRGGLDGARSIRRAPAPARPTRPAPQPRSPQPGITASVSDDTTTTFKATAPMPPATSRAARPRRSPTSRTRLLRRCLLRSPPAPSGPRTTTRRPSRARPRAARRSRSTRQAPAPAPRPRPAPRRHSRRRDHRRRLRRQLDDLQGDGDGRRGQRLRLLGVFGHLRRGLHGPGAARIACLQPRFTGQRQQPGDLRHCRGGLDGQGLHDRRLHGRRGCHRHRGCLLEPRLHDRGRRRQLDDLQGNRHRRGRQRLRLLGSSVTYVEDSSAPAAPVLARFDPGFARERQLAEDHRHSRGRLDGQALHDERLLRLGRGQRHGGSLLEPRPRGRSRRRLDDDLQGDRDRRSRQHLRLLDSESPTSRTRLRRRSPRSLALDPAVARPTTTRPKISGTAEAGSTVKLYTTSDCSGVGRGERHRCRLQLARAHGRRRRRLDHDFQGNGDRCRRQRLRLLGELGHLRRGLDRARRCPASLGSTPASPANDNSPKITGSAEAGSTVKLYTTSDCSGSVAASGTAAAFSSPGITVAVADDSTTTFKATATDAAGNVSRLLGQLGHLRRGLDRAGRARLARLDPGSARERQPPEDLRHRRGRLDGQALHDDRLLRRARRRPAPRRRSPRRGSRSRSPTTRPRPSRRPRPTRPATSPAARARSSPTSRTRPRRPLPASLASTPAGPANDNSPEDLRHRRGRLDGQALHDERLLRRARRERHRRRVRLARASPSRSPTTRPRPSRRRRPTRPATSRGCSASSVTYVEDSTAPAAPGVARLDPRLARERQLARRSPAPPRPARRSSSTRRATAPARPLRAARRPPSLAGDHGRRLRRLDDDLQGDGDRCRRQRLAAARPAPSPTSRTRPRPPLPASLGSTPASPANDNSPKISGSGRGGLDGQALHDERLLGRARR